MKLQANREDILIESKAFIVLNFVEADENFENLNLFFVVSRSKYVADPTLILDSSSLTIVGGKISVELTPEQTDLGKKNYYEVWVEWLPGQWSKEFKGELNLTPSLNYN